MEFGQKTKFLVEFLSNANIDDKVIILSDLANISHSYKSGEIFETYRKLRNVCESWELEEIDDFRSQIHEFVDEQYKNVRNKLGANAIMMVRAIAEDSEDDEKNNKKEFEKGAKKKHKGDNSPIAKAARSKGENQNDMANSIDVDKSTISRIKTGTRRPGFDTLKKLAQKYGKGFINQLLGA